jgi:NADH-quinone oxidoreductase subunit C
MDPMLQKLLVTYISRTTPGILSINVKPGTSPTVIIEIASVNLNQVISFLKRNQQLRFDSLLDLWALDYPSALNRFEINYLLLSVTNQIRVIIRTRVSEYSGLPSVTGLFKAAGWLEREVWDMYGILFFENEDLRRILTDYGFEGHPLRKDFPLSGFSEVRYDDGDKRIVYEPLEVSQEYRSFSFKNPWTYKHE